jgi:endonuclease/exonuclease/phosphatase family metal-dependent hydrolase
VKLARVRDPRRGRWWVRGLLCAALAALAVVPMSSVAAVPARVATPFVLVQMNLCNSGMATTSCYSFGKAVDEAVGKIHRYRPALVTLQEVCHDDLYARDGWGKLARAMADLYGSGHVSVDFVPAVNRDTNDWYRCVNGELFGVAVMHHYPGRDVHHGWYGSQDPSNEIRAWACTTVIEGRLTGCTTHLSTDPDVAMRQCHELMAILASPWVLPQVIVAGDFNLTSAPGRRHDVQDCAAANYDRRGDGALQHVFFTRDMPWARGGYEVMRWTDHPVLYESFRVCGPAPPTPWR